MGLIGTIDIGLSTNVAKFSADMDKASGKVAQFEKETEESGALGSLASNFGKIAALGGGIAAVFGTIGVGRFFASAIGDAANLGESLSKVRAILGDASPAVEAYANTLASRFGLVKAEVLDAESSFGGLGKGLGGLKSEELSGFSNEFTKLAADLQSFANTGSLSEATQALQIALSGEQSDVLKRLGIIINETTTKQYALAHGFDLVNGKLSESQKFQARAGLLREGLADASGDLDRTAGSAKNLGRNLSGTFTNLRTEVGQALEPLVVQFEALASSVLGKVAEAVTNNAGAFKAWIENSIAGGGFLVSAFVGVGQAIGGIADVVNLAGIAWKTFQAIASGSIAGTLEILASLGRGIDSITSVIPGLATDFGAPLTAVARGVGDLANQQFADVENRLKAPPPSEGINKFFADAVKGAQDAQKAFTAMSDADKSKVGEVAAKQEEEEKKKKEKEKKKKAPKIEDEAKRIDEGPRFAGALEFGSKEAFSAELKARSLFEGGDPAKGTEKNTATIAGEAQKQTGHLANIAAKVGTGQLAVASF